MIFEQRFHHVDELRKMAASIQVDGDTATIAGGVELRGAALQVWGLSEGGLLVQARGNSWGHLIFKDLVEFD